MARLLLPSEYGFVAMILVFTNFASVLSGVGIASEIIRRRVSYTFHKSVMNLSFYVGVALSIAIIALSYPIAQFYGNNALILPTIIISFKFIILSLSMTYKSMILKRQMFSLVGKIELTSNIIANTIMIGMAYWGFSYWSLIFPYIIADIYKLTHFKSYTNIKFRIYKFKYTIVAFQKSKQLIRSILSTRIISYWARNLDNMLVGKIYGESSLGLYNRGYRFLNLTEKLFDSLFGSVLYPNLQRLKDKNGDVFREYLFFVGIISTLSFPVGMILILFPDALVRVLWGPNWMEVAKFLPFFGVLVLSNTNKSNLETIFKVFYKDNLLLQVGIYNSILVVGSIIIGSFYSPIMIAKLLAFTQVFLSLPVIIVFAFGVKMKFSSNILVRFYLPRLFFLAVILVSILLNNLHFTIAGVSLYVISILWLQKNSIGRLKNLVLSKFSQ